MGQQAYLSQSLCPQIAEAAIEAAAGRVPVFVGAMTYGLGADKEKPSEETAFSILDTAMENGIDNLDTANNYGDSEAVIGRWLKKRREEKKVFPWIVTKVGPFKAGSYDELRDDILFQTEGCLKNLGMDR